MVQNDTNQAWCGSRNLILYFLYNKINSGVNLNLVKKYYYVAPTIPVLLADYVTTGNWLKMASTAAYNLSDNHCYSIANFNFNLTLIPCSN